MNVLFDKNWVKYKFILIVLFEVGKTMLSTIGNIFKNLNSNQTLFYASKLKFKFSIYICLKFLIVQLEVVSTFGVDSKFRFFI